MLGSRLTSRPSFEDWNGTKGRVLLGYDSEAERRIDLEGEPGMPGGRELSGNDSEAERNALRILTGVARKGSDGVGRRRETVEDRRGSEGRRSRSCSRAGSASSTAGGGEAGRYSPPGLLGSSRCE